MGSSESESIPAGLQSVINSTEKTLKGSILDHIELDSLRKSGDGIYERKDCKSFLEELKDDKQYTYPSRFDFPYCLPFYSKLPHVVHGRISGDVVFAKVEISEIDCTNNNNASP